MGETAVIGLQLVGLHSGKLFRSTMGRNKRNITFLVRSSCGKNIVNGQQWERESEGWHCASRQPELMDLHLRMSQFISTVPCVSFTMRNVQQEGHHSGQKCKRRWLTSFDICHLKVHFFQKTFDSLSVEEMRCRNLGCSRYFCTGKNTSQIRSSKRFYLSCFLKHVMHCNIVWKCTALNRFSIA